MGKTVPPLPCADCHPLGCSWRALPYAVFKKKKKKQASEATADQDELGRVADTNALAQAVFRVACKQRFQRWGFSIDS